MANTATPTTVNPERSAAALRALEQLGLISYVEAEPAPAQPPVTVTPKTPTTPSVSLQTTCTRITQLLNSTGTTAAQKIELETLQAKLLQYQALPARVQQLISQKAQEQYQMPDYATLVNRQIDEVMTEPNVVANDQFTITPICDRLIGVAAWLLANLSPAIEAQGPDFAALFKLLSQALDQASTLSTAPPSAVSASDINLHLTNVLKALNITDLQDITPEQLKTALERLHNNPQAEGPLGAPAA